MFKLDAWKLMEFLWDVDSNTRQVDRFRNLIAAGKLMVLDEFYERGTKKRARTSGNPALQPLQSTTEANKNQKSYLDFPIPRYFLPARY